MKNTFKTLFLLMALALAAAAPARAATPADTAINPFTGLPADANALARRPLLVKVNNEAAVRPQSGLSQADLVVEHIMEGGSTRFDALYLSNTPARVGSTRSCRLIDIELPAIFDAALSCSGTSNGVRGKMAANAHLFPNGGANWQKSLTLINDLGRYECATCVMYRWGSKPAPHNLFANTAAAWAQLAKRGLNQPGGFHGFVFDGAAPGGGSPAKSVSIGYRGGAAGWSYDPASGQWLRSTAGVAQIDAATGKRLSAANVLALTAYHVNTDIVEDSLGSKSIQIQLWGRGAAKLYRDGQVYDATWVRDNPNTQLDIVDASGNKLPLKPGITWIQIVQAQTPVK
jgi:hypothetical protein